MALNVSYFNDKPVYNLSAGKSLPQFLKEAEKGNKSLRYNQEFRNRLELIQDFEFENTSAKVKCSKDGRYICATGGYPYEMKMYDTEQLSMKFCRRQDHENLDFLFLSNDYSKLVFLQANRELEFHARYGIHHKLRVPKFGRTLAYDNESATLLIAGSSDEICRIDLEAGQFLTPISFHKERGIEEVNEMTINSRMPLLGCGGSRSSDVNGPNGNGSVAQVDCFDLRMSNLNSNQSTNMGSLSSLQIKNSITSSNNKFNRPTSITSLDFSPSGMHLACGTNTGIVQIFDLRSSKPIAERDHKNGLPIKKVKYFCSGGNTKKDDYTVSSTDSKCVKIWDYRNYDSNHDSSESDGNLNTESFDGYTDFSNLYNVDDDDDENETTISGSKSRTLLRTTTTVNHNDTNAKSCLDHSSDSINSSYDSKGKTRLISAIESDTPINDMCFYNNPCAEDSSLSNTNSCTGLIFLARDDIRLGSYFIPSLSPAPKWCSFLDSMTEELAETARQTVYDDYTFITKHQVDELNCGELIGSKVLQAYMHGFFIDSNLYQKLKRASEPFDYEEALQKKRLEKIEELRPFRTSVSNLKNDKDSSSLNQNQMINGPASKMRANQALFDRLTNQIENAKNEIRSKNSTKKQQEQAKNFLSDNRFSKMFNNKEFAIEEEELEKTDTQSQSQKRRKKY